MVFFPSSGIRIFGVRYCGCTFLPALAMACGLACVPAYAAADNLAGSVQSDRQQQGLRGAVKTCIDEGPSLAEVRADSKEQPEVTMQSETDYGPDGRLVARFYRTSDHSIWATRHTYDSSGKLLTIASGKEGVPPVVSVYKYDDQGRLTTIDDGVKLPVTFSYEQGVKTKRQVSRPEDYIPHLGVASDSPLGATDLPPNLPGGGTAITTYDENDRPVEVQAINAHGDVMYRAVRTYDAQGNIREDKQIIDDPLATVPPEVRESLAKDSDADSVELRRQLSALMGGHEGFSSVAYTYDAQGRVKQKLRQTFNQEDAIVITYNEQGDEISESTHTVRTGGTPEQDLPRNDSDVRFSYEYDKYGNWIEKVTIVSGPDGVFAPVSKTRRSLTYY